MDRRSELINLELLYVAQKSKPFENQTAALFRTSKVFANILSICTREMTDRAPHVVTSALRIVELAIIKDFDNRIYFHANGAVGQISSILSFALTDAIEKVDPESSNRVKSEWNHQLLIACLRVLAVSLNTSKVEWIPYEYYENIATLFTIARHVEKLGELYRLYELQLGASGSIRKTQTMDVMLNGLHFYLALHLVLSKIIIIIVVAAKMAITIGKIFVHCQAMSLKV